MKMKYLWLFVLGFASLMAIVLSEFLALSSPLPYAGVILAVGLVGSLWAGVRFRRGQSHQRATNPPFSCPSCGKEQAPKRLFTLVDAFRCPHCDAKLVSTQPSLKRRALITFVGTISLALVGISAKALGYNMALGLIIAGLYAGLYLSLACLYYYYRTEFKVA